MNIIERVKNILLTPKGEWEVIKGEEQTIVGLFTKYALILAAIPAVAGFLGFAIIGVSTGFGSYALPFSLSIKWAIFTYILSLVGVAVIAYVIDFLAPYFGAAKDLVASFKVAIFAYTAAWVGGIFNIIPALSIVVLIASIYSLVLLYMGLERVKSVPKEKMAVYFIAVLVGAIIVSIITGAIVSSVAFGGMYNMMEGGY